MRLPDSSKKSTLLFIVLHLKGYLKKQGVYTHTHTHTHTHTYTYTHTAYIYTRM